MSIDQTNLQSLPTPTSKTPWYFYFIRCLCKRKNSKKISGLQIPACPNTKNTLVLDLDQTLIYSTTYALPSPDFKISVQFSGRILKFYVKQRPFLSWFLKKVTKHFQVVIFTASHQYYATQILKKIDPQKKISASFYRQHCSTQRNCLVKDLSKFNRPLQNIVLVDDSLITCRYNYQNSILIEPWCGNPDDKELVCVWQRLKSLVNHCDVKKGLLGEEKVLRISYKATEIFKFVALMAVNFYLNIKK